MKMGTTICRGCGERIGFIKTVAGKHIPVDLEEIRFVETPRGTDKFVMKDGTVVSGRRAEIFEESQIGYISHFATCPKANSFRRR
jgi:hypothetical protein